MFKVGSQLFMAEGPALVKEIVDQGPECFSTLSFTTSPIRSPMQYLRPQSLAFP